MCEIKRFYFTSNQGIKDVFDTEEIPLHVSLGELKNIEQLINWLNRQETTIVKQKGVIEHLQKTNLRLLNGVIQDEILQSRNKEIARQHNLLTYLSGVLAKFDITDWNDKTQIENAVAHYNAGKPNASEIAYHIEDLEGD